MEKRIVVCGSIAYDHVMSFMGEFEESLSGQDLAKLSVSYLAMNRDVHYGGVAGNIGYNLGLLGLEPVIIGAVGDDFEKYDSWLKENRVNTDFVKRVAGQHTPSAFILTDSKENQISIFAPEAMADFHGESFLEPVFRDLNVSIVLVGPDFPARMNKNVADCQDAGVDYVFDPGQQSHMLEEADLKSAISGAKAVIANDFEMNLLRKKTGWNEEQLIDEAGILVETRGEDGAVIWIDGEESQIEAIRPDNIVDPTGCGDAFRAGLLKALHENDDLIHGCRLGAVIATYNIERKGTQNHKFDLNDVVKRMIS